MMWMLPHWVANELTKCYFAPAEVKLIVNQLIMGCSNTCSRAIRIIMNNGVQKARTVPCQVHGVQSRTYAKISSCGGPTGSSR